MNDTHAWKRLQNLNSNQKLCLGRIHFLFRVIAQIFPMTLICFERKHCNMIFVERVILHRKPFNVNETIRQHNLIRNRNEATSDTWNQIFCITCKNCYIQMSVINIQLTCWQEEDFILESFQFPLGCHEMENIWFNFEYIVPDRKRTIDLILRKLSRYDNSINQ